MYFTSSTLITSLGQRSTVAKRIVPALYQALSQDVGRYQHWREVFLLSAPKKLSVSKLAAHYHIQQPEAPHLIFALHTYYALVIKLLAAHFLGDDDDVEASRRNRQDAENAKKHVGAYGNTSDQEPSIYDSSAISDLTITRIINGTFFEEHGITNFCDGDIYDWPDLGLSDLNAIARQFVFDDAPPDALKGLYHDLFPRKLRHTLGEYYTPDWLAEHVLDRLGYNGEGRLLDPSCGSGTFLAHALRRMPHPDLDNIAGIDVNPLACLAARANILLHTGKPHETVTIPVYCADSILNPPAIGHFDFIAGNPPWVNWETLPITYREQTKQLWVKYGLFPHSGMDAILGKGKKDLALLLTYASIDAYLHDRGKLGFILTQTVLKSSGAGAGFRKLTLDSMPLAVLEADDLSDVKAFPGTSTRAAVLIMKKGEATHFPVPYHYWKRTRKTIHEDDALTTVYGKIKRCEFVAEPIDEPDSAWLTGYPEALQGVRKLLGTSDYEAHAGVYTGGANAVYWLDVLGSEDGLLHIRNITEGSKRSVPEIETLLEPDLIFPLLRGRDVYRWKAVPTAAILMVQDPQRRRGYDEDWLQNHYPRTYAYLAQFEENLRERAAYKRYFKPEMPFYSMFDIGTYSFAPVKVTWQGFGQKTMQAVVITQHDGKPIMTNQAMHPFIGLDDEDEAHYLAACLNSAPFEFAVLSHTQAGGKSFAQPGLLKTLRLPKYDPQNSIHQYLVTLSRQAHDGHPDDDAIALATAQLWDLSDQELADMRESLYDWR